MQLAAKEHPDLKLLQGVAESIPLPDNSMDLITASFVFHEIPPRYADQVLQEAHRVLKPGGTLLFIEPSPTHLALGKWQLFRQYGFKGLYFRMVGNNVFEPFIKAWHSKDLSQWLPAHGFQVLEDVDVVPLRTVVTRRVDLV